MTNNETMTCPNCGGEGGWQYIESNYENSCGPEWYDCPYCVEGIVTAKSFLKLCREHDALAVRAEAADSAVEWKRKACEFKVERDEAIDAKRRKAGLYYEAVSRAEATEAERDVIQKGYRATAEHYARVVVERNQARAELAALKEPVEPVEPVCPKCGGKLRILPLCPTGVLCQNKKCKWLYLGLTEAQIIAAALRAWREKNKETQDE